jgi:hypothetical protein
MERKLRTALLFAAALLMGLAAILSATVGVPHLRADMAEINVRPTLLGALSLGLYFGTFAMFAFACLVFVAAIKSAQAAVTARFPLLIIATTYIGFGILAFAWTRSHHALGYVLMGALILAAVLIQGPR